MLNAVYITADCYYTCITHALLSDKEEIMGLLLGNVTDSIATIYDVCIINRSYKKSDRVEVSPQDLVKATQSAEELSEHGFKTRVVGWYHSHPHITPWPSHVDLSSQNSYQMLDKCFVGLIYSVYCTAKTGEERIQLYAFQAKPKEFSDPTEVRATNFERKSVQLFIIHSPEMFHFPCNSVKRITNLISTLFEEEKREFYSVISSKNKEKLKKEKKEEIYTLDAILQLTEESEGEEVEERSEEPENAMNVLINSSVYQYNLLKLMQKFDPYKQCIFDEFERLSGKLEQLNEEEHRLKEILRRRENNNSSASNSSSNEEEEEEEKESGELKTEQLLFF